MFIRRKPLLVRERLLSGIAQAVDAVRFTLICAPPASGKSTLLLQLRQRWGDGCVEVTPDNLRLPSSGIVILQNAERWEQTQLAGLLKGVEHAVTPAVRLVISANCALDHWLPVARLRRQVIEFGPDDLVLSRHEVREFLTPDAHQLIEIRDLNRIYKRVGGWIGAWNIVEAMAENGATLVEISESMSGALPVFRGFFGEYLDQLDNDLRNAILRFGHFDDITPGLIAAVLQCDAATGFDVIQALRSGCPFFQCLHDGVTLRPYPLLQDYIGQRARNDQPQRHRADLMAAAEGARAGSDWLRAAMCFIRVGERDAATKLLSEHTEELITHRGEVARFRTLTHALQHDAELEGALAGELALGAIFAGAFGHARRLNDRAQGDTPDAIVRKEAISLCIAFGFDALEEVVSKAPAWLEQRSAQNPRFASMVAVGLFWSAMEMLELANAERALATARNLSHHANAGLIKDWLSVCEAYLYWEQGRISDADSLLGRASASGPSNHTMNHVRAALAWERGDAPLCRHLLSSSLHRGARHSVVETAFLGWTCAASLHFTEGHPDRAMRLLAEAEATMMARHGERARQAVCIARHRLSSQHVGETGSGQVAQDGTGLEQIAGASARFPALEEARRMALARQLALQGEQRRAISLLQPIISRALKLGRLRVWGEASIIYAGALARLGENERASRIAWDAISQLATGGSWRSILSERIMLAPLLDDLMRRSGLGEHNSREFMLLVELGRLSGRTTGQPAVVVDLEEVLIVQLTDTERRVLVFANRGLSNKLIADHLLIKISTVKWHLHNIFEKLGVRSRTAAIAQARRSGISLD